MVDPLGWIRRGKDAEGLAAAALTSAGFEILARNVRTASGEIDLVARDGTALVVVEVKRRPTVSAGLRSVGAGKKKRLLAAVREARVRLGLPRGLPLRFDVVVVCPDAPPRHFRGAFSTGATFLA